MLAAARLSYLQLPMPGALPHVAVIEPFLAKEHVTFVVLEPPLNHTATVSPARPATVTVAALAV